MVVRQRGTISSRGVLKRRRHCTPIQSEGKRKDQGKQRLSQFGTHHGESRPQALVRVQMATAISQDSLEIYNASIGLLCGRVEFIHASELDAPVKSSGIQSPCLHTRLAYHERDIVMAGDFLVPIGRPDWDELGATTLNGHQHRVSEEHEGSLITALYGGGCKDERQHGAGWVGWAISRGNNEMHFSIPLLAASYNSKWVPIRFSSIFEIAGLIGKVLAPKVRLPAD